MKPERSPAEWKALLRLWAEEVGFDAIGFAPAESPPQAQERLERWLSLGYHASMEWMAKDPERRYKLERILPGAKTVIVVALQYLSETPVPAGPGLPKISRYAQGDDYHDVMSNKLHALRDRLRRESPELRSRIACDTSAILDKAFAAQAGLGWIGKNSLLLSRDLGSWFFLGEIFVDLDIAPDPLVADHCGSCTRCVDACPTGALDQPYVLDANRCIAYWNIEHRGAMDPSWPAQMDDWLVGCDICQDVCPWNRKAPLSNEPRLAANPDLVEKSTEEWLALGEAEYRDLVRHTAISRVKPADMKRNAQIVAANQKPKSHRPSPNTHADRHET